MKFVKTLSNYFLCPICPPHQVWGTGSSAKPISKTGGVIGGGPPTRLWTDHRQRHHQPLARKLNTKLRQHKKPKNKEKETRSLAAGQESKPLGLDSVQKRGRKLALVKVGQRTLKTIYESIRKCF